MKSIGVLLLAAALAGCAGLRPTQAHRYFVLDAPASEQPAAPATPSHDTVLLVAPTSVATFYDTQDMAFSRTAGELSYYQYSSWSEPPGRRLTALLATTIERRGDFRVVAIAGSGIRGQVMLTTHLEEIYHEASALPGTARVTLVAELVDLRHRTLIARRTFSASAPLTSGDAAGAATACGRALGELLGEVAAWAGSAPTS
jgi:cholesterol transport system auxiliary component